MKKVLRYTLRFIAIISGLLLLGWLLLVGFVTLKKPVVLSRISAAFKERTGGEASIENMDLSFFRHFPYITMHLSKVTVRDSLWERHHHDLLKAGGIDLRFSLLSTLFSGKPHINKMFLEQGAIYLFTDSSGYSNTAVFRQQRQPGTEKDMNLPEFSLSDMRFILERQDKKKLFDFDIRRLNAVIKQDKRTLLFELSTDIRIHSFAFNTEKGSFLKDKSISGHFRVQFNMASKILLADKQTLLIDGTPFLLSGRFFPEVVPDPFLLNIQAENIPYKKATALLTPIIQQKLDQYDIDAPVTINAVIDAGSADDPTPQINVRMDVRRGSVSTPVGRFTTTSFQGSFTNDWVHGRKREDENSMIRLLAFSGSWSDFPLKADTITITNFKRPLLTTDMRATLELTRLNQLIGSKSIQFRKGTGELHMVYKGPLSENDSTKALLNGSLDIDSTIVSYQPYHFLLTDCKGKLHFREQDLSVDHLEAHAGSSKLFIKGAAKKLFSLLDKSPEKISMDWMISSPHLDLRDFTPVLGKPVEPLPSKTDKPEKSLFGVSGARLDRFFREGDLHLQLEASDILYRKFSGAHAKADLLFSGNEIKLDHMTIEQGSGSLNLSGSLYREAGFRQGSANPITLQSHIEQADLPKLFTAFNNFGQQAIRDRNLKGLLTADIRMTGALTDKAEIVPNSLRGSVNFTIREGELLDFEPMQKIQVAVLKKRDLSKIFFSELKNQLDLDTTTFNIHRMEIQSTAFTLFVEGIYDLKRGADMSLQVPLSNLKDRNPDIPPSNNGNNSKGGISLHLRARTGDDGKLKVSWDPLRRALKAPRPKARH